MSDVPPPGLSEPKHSDWRGVLASRWAFLVIGLVVGGIIGAAAASGGDAGDGTKGPSVRTQASSSPSAVAVVPPEPTIPEETTPYIPQPSDFVLTVKVRSKQCFGSAGCNITYRILVAYNGPPLDPSVTYDVTYQVKGDESGPQINTLSVTGDESSVQSEESASTRSSSVKLVAKAISVDVA